MQSDFHEQDAVGDRILMRGGTRAKLFDDGNLELTPRRGPGSPVIQDPKGGPYFNPLYFVPAEKLHDQPFASSSVIFK